MGSGCRRPHRDPYVVAPWCAHARRGGGLDRESDEIAPYIFRERFALKYGKSPRNSSEYMERPPITFAPAHGQAPTGE